MKIEQDVDRRIFVASSELRWVKFNAKGCLLTVEFVKGGVYEYYGVPKAEFVALLAADSKGRYFNANIRSNYSHRQIS